MRWNGYLRADQKQLPDEDFATLILAMLAMGPQSTGAEGGEDQPVNVTHERPNDPDTPVKYIMQANFLPEEVSVEGFRQMMADLFGQPVEDIGTSISDVSYSGDGRETREWTFSYPDGVTDRVVIARFGRGSTQADSKKEARAYLTTNAAEWGEEVE